VNDIIVNAWAQIEDGCSISYTVSDDEVELSLGGRDGFQLIASERALATLADACSSALAVLRARQAREINAC
jgi:hypothetical protein